MGENALALITGLVVTVTGFQLYRDANEFYFAHDCRRCDGTGKLTCNKCRGYGYLKKGPDDNVKAFKAGGPDQDVSGIYLCPFCKGTGTLNCFTCRGTAKHWPAQLNVERLFKWRHEHQGAFERHRWEVLTAVNVGKEEAKRKIQTGLGGFKMTGSANLLPLSDEELAAQAAERK